MSQEKLRILILCTGNSCRSHMAEGILRHLAGDVFEVHSAGSNPTGYVHPKAMAVLAEIGIDISAHRSKHLGEFLDQDIHTVITVCEHADQACPAFPGQEARFCWRFEDPARVQGDEQQVMEAFRMVRDQINLVFSAYASDYHEGLAKSPVSEAS